jgi:hypothetical protein
MSNIDWSEDLNLVSDTRVLRYATEADTASFRDRYVIRIEDVPQRWDKNISVEHEHGPMGGFHVAFIGFYPSIASARRAINRLLKGEAS